MSEEGNRKLAELLKFLPDKIYLNLRFYKAFGRFINWENPTTFNEKLQWLKIYDRRPEYTKMVDKYEAKKYVANIIGEEHIIPTLGVWNHFDEIDFNNLPDRFVLKCTHDSGGVVIVKDKNSFDKKKAREKIERCLKNNYYWFGREWAYKNVKPRIIAEAYMEDSTTKDLRDYKLFAFDGVIKSLFVATDRDIDGEETKFDFFDAEFKHLDISNGHPMAENTPKKPRSFDEMKKLAEVLSKGVPHLRVDFYEINGAVYFGELTFAHWSGMMPFQPEEWDKTFGEWIKLPKKMGGGTSR